MITILWWVLVGLCLCLGFLGCFINKIPGPIFVLLATILGVTLLKLPIEWSTVGIVAALAIGSIILSKILVKMVKKLQEFSKRGGWGTTIGSILGLGILYKCSTDGSTAMIIMMFILGLVILPFVCSLLMELTNKQGFGQACKCATSATSAYLADTFLKLVVFGYAIYAIFNL